MSNCSVAPHWYFLNLGKWHSAVVRSWLARKLVCAQKREAEQKLAAEAKLAMEAQAREEAKNKEVELKEEPRIKEQDTLADSEGDEVEECIKEVASPAPAHTVGTEVGLHLQLAAALTSYYSV